MAVFSLDVFTDYGTLMTKRLLGIAMIKKGVRATGSTTVTWVCSNKGNPSLSIMIFVHPETTSLSATALE